MKRYWKRRNVTALRSNSKSLTLFGLLLILVLSMLGHAVALGDTQQGSTDLTEDKPEVQWYAAFAHVSLDEAMRRLRLQDTIDNMDASIRKNYDDIFAGIYIQHKPEYKVIVQFAETVPSGISQLVPNALRNDTEIRQVKSTQKDLEKARSHAEKLLKAKKLSIESYIDTTKNIAVISIDSRSLFQGELDSVEELQNFLISSDQSLLGKIQVGLDLVKTMPDESSDASNQPSSDDWRYVRGGAKLYKSNMASYCTAGFTVWKGTEGKRGLSTAGHCSDVVKYFRYIDLELEQEYYSPPYDVSWFTPIGGWAVTNQIDVGQWGVIDIWYDKWRWAQHSGDAVCKYGRTTGPACGFIKSNSYNGVQVLTHIFVDSGDSGGPFWLNTTAYGTTVKQIIWWEDWEIGWVRGSSYAPVDQLYQQLNVRQGNRI